MRLVFQLRFHTHPGQSLWLSGNHEILGNNDPKRAMPLEYQDAENWRVTVGLPASSGPADPQTRLRYHYVLREADGSLSQDWGAGRTLDLNAFEAQEVLIVDSWNAPGFYENAFYTQPFKNVLRKPKETEWRVPASARFTHTFRIRAPLLEKGQTLCLLGGAAALRNWGTENPVLLERIPGEEFLSARIDLAQAKFPLEYKYGVYDLQRKSFVRYEAGPNRVLNEAVRPAMQTLVNDGFIRLPANTWKGAGIAIPVFSIRSHESFGVGEFTDLKLLADWCQRVGLSLIQILPVNDTIATQSRTDSYPYAAISAFALHPLYINLRRVASAESQVHVAALEPERLRLNALEAVDYEAVLKAKLECLRKLFERQKEPTLKLKSYRAFLERNRDWLIPYAYFCCWRDRYGTADYEQWPAHHRFEAEKLASEHDGEVAEEQLQFHYFVQFHLHRQLRGAADYAHSRGVILKGDLPIGVARHGADTWEHPELFHLNMHAGAPPDAFAEKGQNWSFPTYNWPRLKQNRFAWWKRRLTHMAGYFDAFRIDHILGFFRIWSVPAHAVEGIMGYFVPALPLHINEFSLRGIWFDRNRYTRPYITERVLLSSFGPHAAEVKNQFLDSDGLGNYALKSKFATQRQVADFFASLRTDPQNEAIRTGLFDLISNVILFEVEGSQGQQYHFRFAIEKTSSFQDLDGRTRQLLWDLYLDYFFRRQDKFWMNEAMEKLPALKAATDLLICGEDLGLVPPVVPVVMQQLGLLGLEVQRMPKRLGAQFARPAEAPYLSVVTPSTHDMSTIRGWWTEDRTVTQRFYNQELQQFGTAPAECEPWINRAIVRQHLSSPAMWSIFQVQDLLGMDANLRRKDPASERINVPADVNNYWRYRMHLPLETLTAAEDFNNQLTELLSETGRAHRSESR